MALRYLDKILFKDTLFPGVLVKGFGESKHCCLALASGLNSRTKSRA